MKPQLKRFIQTVGDLPSMPAVAANVMRMIEDPDSSAEDLRQVIDRDPALAARILKVANSSLYGFSRQIETLSHAIALLGFRAVGSLVLASSLREVFRRFGLSEKLLWEHSMVAGALGGALASHPKIGLDPEESFVAGLLHDLGKIALNNSAREAYTRVFARVYNEGSSFVLAEREEFGFDHAELGAEVIAKWKLPAKLETAIRHHHTPDILPDLPEPERRLTALVSVTTACCTRLGIGRRGAVEELDLAALPAWSALGLGPEDTESVLELAAEQAEQAKALES